MPSHIPRRDIIALGGNFTIDKFDSSALPRWATTDSNRYQQAPLQALDGKRVYVDVIDGYSDILLTPEASNGMDQVRLQVGMFQGETSRNRGRVAQFVAPMDREAGDALAIDYWSHQPHNQLKRPGVACYDMRTLADLNLDMDAGQYAAQQRLDHDATKHYRGLGADPLRPTQDGDCAARLSIAHGDFTFTQTPDLVNARHLATGETGAFDMARQDRPGVVASLVHLGLDCTIQNNDGKTVLDCFRHASSREEVEHAMASVLQDRLEANTAPVPAWYELPDLTDDRVLDAARAQAPAATTVRRGMRL